VGCEVAALSLYAPALNLNQQKIAGLARQMFCICSE
jgi:hypothetical protein